MKTIIKRDRAALEKRRLMAGKLFQKGESQAAIAAKLQVTTAAVCKWHAHWKDDTRKGLLSKGPTGADPILNAQKRQILKKAILSGPAKAGYATDFWTLERIKALAKKKLKIDLGTTSIWRVVIGLGFSVQKPERRARERNERAITDWKLKTFPRLKKMGRENGFLLGFEDESGISEKPTVRTTWATRGQTPYLSHQDPGRSSPWSES